VPKLLPGVRAVEARGLVPLRGDVLEPRKVDDGVKPSVHHTVTPARLMNPQGSSVVHGTARRSRWLTGARGAWRSSLMC
jgi:hypothetical protein